MDPLTTRCALLDNCICETNNDCGVTQTCTNVAGYVYNVCKTRNEVPERYPLSKDKFPSLNNILAYLAQVPAVASATLARCRVNNLLNIFKM